MWVFYGGAGFRGAAGGKPPSAINSPAVNVLEAEGNLNPYKPLGCLYSQFSLSRGDISLQLLGFGIGMLVCCDIFSGEASCGVSVLADS